MVEIQVVVAEVAIETLDEAVLHGMAGANERQLHAVRNRPVIERATDALRAIVAHGRLRAAVHYEQALKRLHDAPRRELAVLHKQRTLPREVILERAHAARPALDRGVTHKIHAPALASPRGPGSSVVSFAVMARGCWDRMATISTSLYVCFGCDGFARSCPGGPRRRDEAGSREANTHTRQRTNYDSR